MERLVVNAMPMPKPIAMTRRMMAANPVLSTVAEGKIGADATLKARVRLEVAQVGLDLTIESDLVLS